MVTHISPTVANIKHVSHRWSPMPTKEMKTAKKKEQKVDRGTKTEEERSGIVTTAVLFP